MQLFTNHRPKTAPYVTLWFSQHGIPVPESFASAFAPFNGARKSGFNVYPGPPEDDVSVEYFFDLDKDSDTREIVEGWQDFKQPDLVPFAQSAGGNYVCVHKIDGSIWFADHDLCGDPDAVRKLEPSLTSFLSKLKRFALD